MSKKNGDTSWKIINRSHMGSYSLWNIVRLLWIVKFQISIRYIPRLFWVMGLSFITFPLRIIEKIRFEKKINNTKVVKDPIFIIGFYRTATTLLHILLSKDSQFAYLSNLDTFAALYNISFSQIADLILRKRMPKTRPMDNIELEVLGPQEEDYAVATISKYGIPNALIFPRKFDYFTRYGSFKECSQVDITKWKAIYVYFVQKLTLKYGGKQLVLKNPVNSARIPYLLEMYPNAKFIYLYRNPYTLFCSTELLFTKLMELSALQTWNIDWIMEMYAKLLGEYFEKFEDTKTLIPPKNFIEIQYELFVENPLPFLEEIYKRFDLEKFNEIKPSFQQYIESKRTYKTNIHYITQREINIVNMYWEKIRAKYGYVRLDHPES